MVDAFLFFFTGLVWGAVLVFMYGSYRIEKVKKAKEALLTQIKAKVAEMDKQKESIKDRLIKASELAQTQIVIRGQLEMPSNGALHSKYKNELMHEMQDIEQQKIDILKTILAEGFDPMITIVNDTGTKSEIALSGYVNEAIILLSKSLGDPIPPSTDSTNPKKN